MAGGCPPTHRKHHAFAGVAIATVVGFVAGATVGLGCATSDQVLEQKRRKDVMAGADSCSKGAHQECYSGPIGTAGRGACKFGDRVCEQEGVWGACAGEVVPGGEKCNQLDDDCDGIVDNGFERDGAVCFFKGAKGACRTQGAWHCSEDGAKSTCNAKIVKPSPETCDGIDNDCDGQTDEDSVSSSQKECDTGKIGVCDTGTNKCVNAKVRCIQDVQPGVEICNKLDDNCDGKVDEDCVSEEEAAKQLKEAAKSAPK